MFHSSKIQYEWVCTFLKKQDASSYKFFRFCKNFVSGHVQSSSVKPGLFPTHQNVFCKPTKICFVILCKGLLLFPSIFFFFRHSVNITKSIWCDLIWTFILTYHLYITIMQYTNILDRYLSIFLFFLSVYFSLRQQWFSTFFSLQHTKDHTMIKKHCSKTKF